MSKKQSQTILSRPVSLLTLPKKGKRLTVTLSDSEKSEICTLCALKGITAFEAKVFLENKAGRKLRLTGCVTADIFQTCIISLEPVPARVEEEIDLTLISEVEATKLDEKMDDDGSLVISVESEDIDTYKDNLVDVGAIVMEHFALALDPYPRLDDVDFEELPQARNPETSPFAGLAALKSKMKPN